MIQRSASSFFFWLAVVCAVTAIGIHTYLTEHHLDLQSGTTEGTSICNINQQMDCDSVNSSEFSEVFGIPLALWGAVANAAILLLLVWGKLTGFRNEHLSRLSLLLSGGILAASLVMGLISFTQLNTFCLFCIISYVASLGLFVGVLKMVPHDLSQIGQTFKYLFTRGENGGFSYLVFLALIPGFVLLFNGMLKTRFGSDFGVVVLESMAQWKTNSKFEFDTSSALHLKDASKTYRMHIVEFADFNCSHCKHAAPTLHAFAKTRKDVQFTFMNFPLDGSCNPGIDSPGVTCAFAKATVCANNIGKGWEVHDWFFQNQEEPNKMESLFSKVAIDQNTIKSCMESATTHEQVMKQATQGKDAGVRGTPTIFVNGRQLPRGQFMPILTQAYNSLN